MRAPWSAPPPFTTLDRSGWTALARVREPEGARAGSKASPGSVRPPAVHPFTTSEWIEVYVPLAHVIGMHLDTRTEMRGRLDAAGWRRDGVGPLIVGLAGSVAVGKSTSARALADLLAARPDHPEVAVVSTDGFLLPNTVLTARGLLARKGFPETYDDDLVASVLGRIALGHRNVEVPRYSHRTFDIDGPPHVLGRPDVVIVEGINALTPVVADFCSLQLYVDAAEEHLRAWFVARFKSLVANATGDPGSFFAGWAGMAADEVHGLAVAVWEHVNLVNLDEHILPTRWRADIVLRKGPDHAVTHVAMRLR